MVPKLVAVLLRMDTFILEGGFDFVLDVAEALLMSACDTPVGIRRRSSLDL